MTINSASPAALSQPQPIPAQMPANQQDWQQFASTLNQWLQYLNGPEIAFTPTLVGVGGGTPVYSAQSGIYALSGNRVTFSAQINLASAGSLSGALGIALTGLPVYTQSAAPLAAFPVMQSGVTLSGSNYVLFAYLSPGSNGLTLWTGAPGGGSNLLPSQLSANALLLVSGSYLI